MIPREGTFRIRHKFRNTDDNRVVSSVVKWNIFSLIFNDLVITQEKLKRKKKSQNIIDNNQGVSNVERVSIYVSVSSMQKYFNEVLSVRRDRDSHTLF